MDHRNRRTLIWIVLIIALHLSSLFPAFAAAPGKIILGYAAPGARALPFWMAQELGLFDKYGVDVEPVFIRGAPILVAGLASGDIHVGSTGGSATLAAVAGGQDLKIIATFGSRNTFDLVAQPNIKRPEDLRGKRIGLTSIGGTTWMALLLWLEHFGLDVQRDQMQLQVMGEQALTTQALQNGVINAAILDGIFSRRLKPKGFTIVGEYSELKVSIRQPSFGGAARPAPTTRRHAGKSVEGRNRRIGICSGAEKQTGGDQDIDAACEDRRRGRGRRLSRSDSRYGTQAAADGGKLGPCAAFDEIAKSQDRRRQNPRPQRCSNHQETGRQRFYRPGLRRAGDDLEMTVGIHFSAFE